MKVSYSGDYDAIMRWLDTEVTEGENGILIYPNLLTFRQIYSRLVKNELETGRGDPAKDEAQSQQHRLLPRIMLIASFYETIESVKHNLAAVGINAQHQFENGSLVVVDSFKTCFPDIGGMKKLVASLSERATREGRAGVTAIINMGFFFLFGGDGEAMRLINYEASLPAKTAAGMAGRNVRGFSCYNRGDYDTLDNNQKRDLTEGQKKVLEIKNYIGSD
jgi:hypothetical protein